MILNHREALADIANALGLTTAVEVGTHQAVFACGFMARFRGSIHLIDPWEGFDEGFETYYPHFREDVRDRNEDYEIAKAVMLTFGDRVSFHRMKSEEAYSLFADESVGVVYIDAKHDYENVAKDLALWFPKVAKGGIISGHDFSYSLPGVVQAVTEFSHRNNLEISLTKDDMPSWWITKWQ
jgi:hypothetical protein